jgi:hypothetical protein
VQKAHDAKQKAATQEGAKMAKAASQQEEEEEEKQHRRHHLSVAYQGECYHH